MANDKAAAEAIRALLGGTRFEDAVEARGFTHGWQGALPFITFRCKRRCVRGRWSKTPRTYDAAILVRITADAEGTYFLETFYESTRSPISLRACRGVPGYQLAAKLEAITGIEVPL